MVNKNELNLLVDHLFRHESGKLVSFLTRIFGAENVELAEDVVQDALVEALNIWSFSGVPENPTGWLYRVSKNKAINVIKHEKQKLKPSNEELNAIEHQIEEDSIMMRFDSENQILDDQLRMIFVCCHPLIPEESQIALTLKTLCGFSIQEISSAFLTNEESINKRLVRARQKLRKNKVKFEVPGNEVLLQRQNIVLRVIYLLFNEGYSASSGNILIRFDLCNEAIRLTELLSEHPVFKHKSKIYALLSLMQLNVSRYPSRKSINGYILTLSEQDRSLWDQKLINKGLQNLAKSTSEDQLSIYHILATISAYHCVAKDFESTNWKGILSLYNNLLTMESSPVILLNRAIALAKVEGAAKGLAELKFLKDAPSLKCYSFFYSTQAAFLMELKYFSEAADCLIKAIDLSIIPAEKQLLKKRLFTCKENI